MASYLKLTSLFIHFRYAKQKLRRKVYDSRCQEACVSIDVCSGFTKGLSLSTEGPPFTNVPQVEYSLGRCILEENV